MTTIIKTTTKTEKQQAWRASPDDFTKLGKGFLLEHRGVSAEKAIMSSWAQIAGTLFPDAIITDRSGFEGGPVKDEDGNLWLFMSGPYSTRNHQFGKLNVSMRQGAGPVSGDMPFMGYTRFASQPRAFLDNLTFSRSRSGPKRTLGVEYVENQIDALLNRSGEEGVNSLRDEARKIARVIGREEELRDLDNKIGSALGTRKARVVSPLLKARTSGKPYDANAISRLTDMASYLLLRDKNRIEAKLNAETRASNAFLEAYFSNFIEGTRFAVEDAREIVETGSVPKNRPADGRDVLMTYKLFSGPKLKEMRGLDDEEALSVIRGVNASLMNSRPEMSPGEFKTHRNFAGDTEFVRPELVYGTLIKGLDVIRNTEDAFSRAVMLHALLTDVHPFNDGNGRTARALMGNELECAGLSRVCVPTVFRNDYIDAQRAYTRRQNPDIIVRSLIFCQEVTAACSHPDVSEQIERWASAYGFCEDNVHAKLTHPSEDKDVVWHNGVPAPADYWVGVEQGAGPLSF